MEIKRFDQIRNWQNREWASIEGKFTDEQIDFHNYPEAHFDLTPPHRRIAAAGQNYVRYVAGWMYAGNDEQITKIIQHELTHVVIHRLGKSQRHFDFRHHGEAFFLMHYILWGNKGSKHSEPYWSKQSVHEKAKEAARILKGLMS